MVMGTKANDRQVGGDHYKDGGKPEHWDLVDMYNWDYFQGQIIKYLMRWRSKNGVQDLEKAAHFLQKYIELHQPKPKSEKPARTSIELPIPGPGEPGYMRDGK